MELIKNIEQFIARNPNVQVHDEISLALEDLYDIDFPSKKDSRSKTDVDHYSDKITKGNAEEWGSWFFYPWLNLVVHFPPQIELRRVRTSRNLYLINKNEQDKLYNSSILIAGMSVGSNVVEALVSQGVAGKLVIVDMDIIEPSNLNRIRSPYHHVGLQKTEAISRKINEIDPYIQIVRVDEGLTERNLPGLVKDNSVDILIDEMDDLKMKLFIRKFAKKAELPVIMAADDGDNAVLEIERYDLDKHQQILGGRIPDSVVKKIEQGKMTRPEQGIAIGKYFVGFDHVPLRMFESLMEVGKSIPSWPQLGGAAALSGVSLAYVAKKIILGEKIKDGQILVSIDDCVGLEHKTIEHGKRLTKFIAMMNEGFDEG